MSLANRDRRDIPRYAIGVAAQLAGATPHALRAYEQAGLIRPARSSSNIRLYSDNDISLLRRIHSLTERGVNLAGVKVILAMEAERGR